MVYNKNVLDWLAPDARNHYRKQVICRLGITDGKDPNPDGKDFAVRKQTAKSDGKDKSAKSTLS